MLVKGSLCRKAGPGGAVGKGGVWKVQFSVIYPFEVHESIEYIIDKYGT